MAIVIDKETFEVDITPEEKQILDTSSFKLPLSSTYPGIIAFNRPDTPFIENIAKKGLQPVLIDVRWEKWTWANVLGEKVYMLLKQYLGEKWDEGRVHRHLGKEYGSGWTGVETLAYRVFELEQQQKSLVLVGHEFLQDRRMAERYPLGEVILNELFPFKWARRLPPDFGDPLKELKLKSS